MAMQIIIWMLLSFHGNPCNPDPSFTPTFTSGFFYLESRRYDCADFFSGGTPMIEEPSTLYAKLLGETASIRWEELQPFFARGALLWVEPSLDLIAAAQAMAENQAQKVADWLATGALAKVSETRAQDLLERDPSLWAVVVSPWVMIQERATG
nr:DUF2288 domain-containing protein [Pseudomonas asplenii]